ncbi:hypothetical protein ACFWAR_26350 [Streptomyces sp. NPDC059917]|uniref:hypothetical protein n=1 Tax=Streptomyces sp. NPDC059917 TaxID=3347002 RepID=UPI003652A117
MQQGEHSQQGLAPVDGWIRCPSAEQQTLLVKRQRRAGEAARSSGGQTTGGIDEDDLPGSREAEKLSEHDQPTLSGLGRAG